MPADKGKHHEKSDDVSDCNMPAVAQPQPD